MYALTVDAGFGNVETVEYDPLGPTEWLAYVGLGAFTCVCTSIVYSVVACVGALQAWYSYGGSERLTCHDPDDAIMGP